MKQQKPLSDDLHDYLFTTATERAEKFTVQLVDTWPRLTAIEQPTYLGSYSWTLTQDHTRLIYKPTVLFPFGLPQTPGEIMRDWLDWKYPKRLRCTARQKELILAPRSFPRMAVKGTLENGVYLDLKSAYWSIISAVGWDVDYFPGKFIGVSSQVWDFPLQSHKPARSSLVTAGLSSPVRLWAGHRLQWKATNNIHINYGLWALVQDVLHGVASDMVNAGAIYVHTDGYILPSDKIGDGFAIAKEWGLNIGVKAQGVTRVYGVGVYQVGDAKTKRQKTMSVPNHIHIQPHEKEWLKTHFSRWANRARKRD